MNTNDGGFEFSDGSSFRIVVLKYRIQGKKVLFKICLYSVLFPCPSQSLRLSASHGFTKSKQPLLFYNRKNCQAEHVHILNLKELWIRMGQSWLVGILTSLQHNTQTSLDQKCESHYVNNLLIFKLSRCWKPFMLRLFQTTNVTKFFFCFFFTNVHFTVLCVF